MTWRIYHTLLLLLLLLLLLFLLPHFYYYYYYYLRRPLLRLRPLLQQLLSHMPLLLLASPTRSPVLMDTAR